MNFKGKSELPFCYVPLSFVLVVSVTFLPNIKMNSIYYDVLKLNLKPVNWKNVFRSTLV